MINNLTDLINASKEFSLSEEIIHNKEKGRHEFITEFPMSSIQTLSLDEYCVGTSNNSFCYWLEFKKILFGIGGGNASKFGIYKSKDGNYFADSGNNKIALNGVILEEKFSKIKKEIIQGLELVRQEKIEEISNIERSIWNIVLLKIFCIYYPEKFLTIGDPKVILELARNIGIENVALKNENSILINYLCRKKLNSFPEFSNWGYEKIGTFIWDNFKELSKRDYYIIGSKYGENANEDIFPEMFNRSIVATGFARDLDLTEYYNTKQSEIKAFLKSNNKDDNTIYAMKNFLSIKPGDLIAIKGSGNPKGNKGYLSIVGIAEVVEKNGKVYEYDPNGLGHIINVDYNQSLILEEFPFGGYGRTIHKLSKDEHIKSIFKSEYIMSFYPELLNFIDQSKTMDLRYSKYVNNFQGLIVKVGFGKGNQARVPWIAFLKNENEVQNGIYPVYLFYKENNLLILAYGISETNVPSIKWNIDNGKTIKQYFSDNELGKPDRYGSSFVFEIYNLDLPLDENKINNDLNKLINIYKASPNNIFPVQLDSFNHELFYSDSNESGLYITKDLSLRFISSLLSKPFVILTGLSGSGKTKLAQAFAMWICESKDQYCIIPVGADWTNREPLLGFPNALKSDEYVKPDNKVLDLIITAIENPDKPYFLILDEMNLSHVERYFADFLSVMETSKKIFLHSGNAINNNVPLEVELPKNLFIIGTVNIDETTYMFSPKVLDRANVIEFRVTFEDMKGYLESSTNLNINELNEKGKDMAEDFVKIALDRSLILNNKSAIGIELLNFFKELKKTGAEFGYRSASEILRFTAIVNKIEPDWSEKNIIDASIMQKLLPKVHGSRKKLEPVLRKLGELCLKETNNFDDILKSEDEKIYSDKGKYPISLEKICRMYKNLMHNGFTSYAEA